MRDYGRRGSSLTELPVILFDIDKCIHRVYDWNNPR